MVTSFYVQYEDLKSIEEALNIIKSWNTTWSPQYFITDYCEAEYNAIHHCELFYFIVHLVICDLLTMSGNKSVSKRFLLYDVGKSVLVRGYGKQK